MRKKYFLGWWDWSRLPREAVDAPSLGVFKIRLSRLWVTWSVERCPCLWQEGWTIKSFKITIQPKPCYECVFFVLVCSEITFLFFLSAYYCGSTSLLINEKSLNWFTFFFFFFSVGKAMSGRTSSSSHVSVSVPEIFSSLFRVYRYPRVFWCACIVKFVLHCSNFCFVAMCFLGKLFIMVVVNTKVYYCTSVITL